jgi:phage-related protein
MPIALNKTAEAFGYTGRSAQNDLYNALKKGKITFDEFNNKLIELDGGVGGFAELARKSSGGIGTAFTNMKTAVVRGVTNVIESIDKMLTSNGLPNLQTIISNVGKKFEEVLNGIANNLPNIVNKIKEVYETLKPWLPLIGSIVAGIIAFNATVGIINAVKNAFNALKISITAVNLALRANPFVFILSAAIAAVLLIIQYWDPIKSFFAGLWEGIKSVAIAIWEPIKSAWNSTVSFFINLWNGIVGFFSNLWNGIVSVATTIWNGVIVAWQMVVNTVVTIFTPIIAFFIGIWDNIKTAAAAYWEIIKNVILGPILLLIDLVTGNLNDFKSHLSQIWNNIKDAANTIWTSLKNIVMSIIDAFISGAKTIFNAFKQFITSIWNGIKTVSSTLWNAIVSGITTIINGFVETVKTVISGFKSFLESTWNSIKTTASSIWTAMKQSVSSIVTGMLNAIVNAWNTIKDKTKAAFEAVVGFIQDPLEAIDLFQIGVDIIQGLINGIDSMASAVWDKVKSIVDGVKNAITGALGIHSPSRWMRDMVGKNMMLGWQIGIDKQKSSTLKKAGQMAEWMKPDVSDFVGGLRGFVPISHIVPTNVAPGTSGRIITNNKNNTFSPKIVNNFIKTESSPSEIARKQKQQMQRLALEWGY